MNENTAYTSRMTTQEIIMALAWLPVHIWLLPMVLYNAIGRGYLNEVDANLLCYALGFAYMLIYELGFLRRDFDPLCDRPLRCLLNILGCYAIMMGINFFINLLFVYLLPEADNQNNSAVIQMIYTDSRKMETELILLAPVLEELIFRGGIFNLARKYNRILAYAMSILCFSAYHVWPYAVADARYWVFLLQYIPVSYLLTRCYERTDSILCSIIFHALVNGVSLAAINAVQGLV